MFLKYIIFWLIGNVWGCLVVFREDIFEGLILFEYVFWFYYFEFWFEVFNLDFNNIFLELVIYMYKGRIKDLNLYLLVVYVFRCFVLI